MKQAPITIFLLLQFAFLYAQKPAKDYQHEIRVISDNDNYLFNFKDGYYANGFFVVYTHPANWKKKNNIAKIISECQVGQKIFISQSYLNISPEFIDRPFSGYLYFQKGYKWFYKSGDVLDISAAIGGTGKKSYGNNIQNWFHGALGLPEVKGWRYQLDGETAFNISAGYYLNLYTKLRPNSKLAVSGTGNINIGNAFTNASAGLLCKIGNFEKSMNSSFYYARTGKGTAAQLKRKAELFFYVHPQLMYQVYNATIQGPLFHKQGGAFISEPVRWVYFQDLGIHFAENKWTLDLRVSLKLKEAKSMRSNKEAYAGITTGYRFVSK